MKKLFFTLLLSAILLGDEAQIVESNISAMSVQIQQDQPASESNHNDNDGINVQKVIGIIATPIFVAGAIVTAVVTAPIWLTKKIFD